MDVFSFFVELKRYYCAREHSSCRDTWWKCASLRRRDAKDKKRELFFFISQPLDRKIVYVGNRVVYIIILCECIFRCVTMCVTHTYIRIVYTSCVLYYIYYYMPSSFSIALTDFNVCTSVNPSRAKRLIRDGISSKSRLVAT